MFLINAFLVGFIKKKQGYTMIELMIVVTILGIVLSFLTLFLSFNAKYFKSADQMLEYEQSGRTITNYIQRIVREEDVIAKGLYFNNNLLISPGKTIIDFNKNNGDVNVNNAELWYHYEPDKLGPSSAYGEIRDLSGSVVAKYVRDFTAEDFGSFVRITVTFGKDSKNIKTSITTVQVPGISYEAEEAILDGPYIESSNSGYSGTGYVVFNEGASETIEWNNVYAPSEGEYIIQVRYSGIDIDKPLELFVNDVQIVTLSMPPTEDLNTWEIVEYKVLLQSGNNKITLGHPGTGGHNIDLIKISRPTVTPSATPESSPTPTIPVLPAYRINAGGAAYTDTSGNIWNADQAWSAGSFGYIQGTTMASSNPIGNTEDDVLYQSCRYVNNGNLEYRFDNMGNGNYRIRLHFAEIQVNKAGQRVFNIAIEGSTVETNFDIFAQAGANNALIKTYLVTLSDGQLNIFFNSGTKGKPMVSAIEVIPVVATPTPTPNATLTPTPTPAVTSTPTPTPSPTPTPVSYTICNYSFEEASGNIVYDMSDYGNDGTIVGTASRVSGYIGTALSFNGSTYVNVPNSASFDNINTELMIDFFCYPTSTGSTRTIVQKMQGNTGFDVSLSNANKVVFTVNRQSLTSASSLPLSNWTHVTVNYAAGGQMKIFINDIQDAQANAGANASNPGVNMRLGSTSNSKQYFVGYLDEFKLKYRIQ